MNPVPFTVTVIAAPPATALDGVTDVTVGLGLSGAVGVGFEDEPPPPPQAVRKIAVIRVRRERRKKLANRCEHTSENIELGPWVMPKEVDEPTEFKAE